MAVLATSPTGSKSVHDFDRPNPSRIAPHLELQRGGSLRHHGHGNSRGLFLWMATWGGGDGMIFFFWLVLASLCVCFLSFFAL